MDLIRSINWIISISCNCRCVHCDIWQQKDARKISAKQIRKVLDDPIVKRSYKHYGSNFDIALGGGEPFGVKNLQEIVNEIEGTLPGSFKTISTNGLLSDRIITFVKLNALLNFKLNISVDGIGKVHDSIRGKRGVFNKVVEMIINIRKIKPSQRIELKLTLLPQNYNQIVKVYRLADKLNCEFSFKPAENIGNYTNKTVPINTCFTKEQLCIIRNQAFYLSDEFRKKGDLKKSKFFQDIPFYLFSKKKPNLCSVLDNDITLMPDGSCYSCVMMPSLGNLSGTRLSKIWENRPRNVKECHSCMLMCGTFKDYSGDYFKQRIANFEITNNCNLNCAMCTQKELRLKKKVAMTDQMSLVRFKRVLKKYDDITHVSFVGGESFLNKHFFGMMNFLDKKGVTYELTTNGTLINRNKVKELKNCAGLKKINFSLDGLGRYHNQERGKGVFQKCVKAIELVNDFFNLNVCTVVKSDNLKAIPKLSNYLAKLGIRSQKIIYGMNLDKNVRNLSKNRVSSIKIQGPRGADQVKGVEDLNQLFSGLEDTPINITFEPQIMRTHTRKFLEDQPVGECKQLHQFRFNSSGERIICEFIRNAYTAGLQNRVKTARLPICAHCCKMDSLK